MNLRQIEDALEISAREPLLSSGLELEPPSSQALIKDQTYNVQMGQGVQG